MIGRSSDTGGTTPLYDLVIVYISASLNVLLNRFDRNEGAMLLPEAKRVFSIVTAPVRFINVLLIDPNYHLRQKGELPGHR